MSSENNSGYKPPIIDHVPTPEELAAGTRADRSETSDEVVPRQDLDALMGSMGYTPPERTISQSRHEPASEATRDRSAPLGPPHIEPEIDQTMTPEALKRLRAEINGMTTDK